MHRLWLFYDLVHIFCCYFGQWIYTRFGTSESSKEIKDAFCHCPHIFSVCVRMACTKSTKSWNFFPALNSKTNLPVFSSRIYWYPLLPKSQYIHYIFIKLVKVPQKYMDSQQWAPLFILIRREELIFHCQYSPNPSAQDDWPQNILKWFKISLFGMLEKLVIFVITTFNANHKINWVENTELVSEYLLF